MRKTYHLCLSSHEEAMARSDSDLDRMFNCFAEAIIRTESRAIADAEMTSHSHSCVQTDDHRNLMFIYRNGYSRFFNSKYSRKGRLGEKDYFCSELNGIKRLAACLSYVKRQGLHHGLSETAFGYRHCSSNVVFQRQLGKYSPDDFMPEKSRYKFLSSRAGDYSNYRMDSSGLLLREDVIDVAYAEEVYVTPRNFLFQMTRYSDDKWVSEQKEENASLPPVTLELVENGVVDADINLLKRNEKGWIDRNILTDIELCSIIDNEYVPRFCKMADSPSIYLLDKSKRVDIGNKLWKKFNAERDGHAPLKVSSQQIRRCLALDYDGK